MKLYFPTNNDGDALCYPLAYWRSRSRESTEPITLHEAEPERGTEFVWCNSFGLISEKSECNKRGCERYSPCNRRSGKCKFAQLPRVADHTRKIRVENGKVVRNPIKS